MATSLQRCLSLVQSSRRQQQWFSTRFLWSNYQAPVGPRCLPLTPGTSVSVSLRPSWVSVNIPRDWSQKPLNFQISRVSIARYLVVSIYCRSTVESPSLFLSCIASEVLSCGAGVRLTTSTGGHHPKVLRRLTAKGGL